MNLRKNTIFKKSEKQIQNEILEYLNFIGVFCFPVKKVGIYDPTKKTFRRIKNKYDINGLPDIHGVFKGRPLYIEVKTPKTKNNLSPDQKKFKERAIKENAVYMVAVDVQDVILALSKV